MNNNALQKNPRLVNNIDDDDDDDDEMTPLILTSSLRMAYGSPASRKSLPGRSKTKTISMKLRWLTNASALVCVFFFSGIIFGWAPLQLLLERQGQYAMLCDNDATTTTTTTTTPCVAQMTRFNRVFTLAQFFLSFASLPVGFLLDHAPKTLHYTLAACLEVAGLWCMATTDYSLSVSNGEAAISTPPPPLVDGFVVGYTLLALGGSMAMLGAFPASFLLPKFQGGILASVSCLFDASSLIFAIFGTLNARNPTLFTKSNLFGTYAVWCVVVFGVLTACWAQLESLDWKKAAATATAQPPPIQSNKSEDSDDRMDDDNSNDVNEETDQTHARRIHAMGLHHWSLGRQLTTLDFLVVLVFASVHMLRCNFYIETVNQVLLSYGDDKATYANWFGFVLPTGVAFVPLIDLTVRKYGVVKTLHFTNGLGVLFGCLLLIPNLQVQAFNFVVFTCFRAYLYATLNTFIAVTFGVRTMGRVIGCAFTTAAIVTLLQYPAATLAEDVCQGNFALVHWLFLAMTALPVAFGWYYSHIAAQDQQQQEQKQYAPFEDNDESRTSEI